MLAAPILFGFGYALQHFVLNRTLGRDILPPLLVTFGLSIIIQNGLLEAFSADTKRLDTGVLEIASVSLLPGLAVGVMPLLTLASAVGVIFALNYLFYRTPTRPRLSRHVGRPGDRPAHGHRQPNASSRSPWRSPWW